MIITPIMTTAIILKRMMIILIIMVTVVFSDIFTIIAIMRIITIRLTIIIIEIRSHPFMMSQKNLVFDPSPHAST